MKYSKTEAGQAAFKARSAQFSTRQRSMFILCDSIRDGAQVLKDTSALGASQQDLDAMVANGFLQVSEAALVATKGPGVTANKPVSNGTWPDSAPPNVNFPTRNVRFAAAVPIATRLTAALGLRGFRLNLAVQAAGNFEDLVALLPRLEEAIGPVAIGPLREALRR